MQELDPNKKWYKWGIEEDLRNDLDGPEDSNLELEKHPKQKCFRWCGTTAP